MNDNRYAIPQSREQTVDKGLQAYMQRVYNVMAAGLVVTGLVAFFVASSPQLLMAIHGTALKWVVMFAPLGIIFFGLNPSSMRHRSSGFITGMYFLLTALMGMSLSYIFLAYTAESITRVFFIAAIMFSGMSIYGYTTKRDLSGMGSLMIMAVWGIFIASLVNLFLGSSGLQFAISVIGVIAFTGLTAWDTQRIKEMYSYSYGGETLTKMAVMASLSLYLDFINLFMFLLSLMGDRR